MAGEELTHTKEPEKQAPAENVRSWEYISLAIYLGVLAVVMMVGIILYWPVTPLEGADPSGALVTRFLFFRVELTAELRLISTVIMAGALGGLIHCLRSLFWHVGNHKLRRSWYLYYFGVPLVGAIMSLIFYFVLRGGLFSPQVTVSETNPFGFIAIAGLVGMFSDKAAEKLKELADSVFASQETPEGGN